MLFETVPNWYLGRRRKIKRRMNLSRFLRVQVVNKTNIVGVNVNVMTLSAKLCNG